MFDPPHFSQPALSEKRLDNVGLLRSINALLGHPRPAGGAAALLFALTGPWERSHNLRSHADVDCDPRKGDETVTPTRTQNGPIRAALIAVGDYIPERTVTAEDINRRVRETTQYSITNGLIQRLTGVRARRYRSDDEQCSDLAAKAGARALERAAIAAEEIDLLLFASCTQDISEPATANIVQEKLGCTQAQVFDIKNACNSFLNGIDVADSHIRAGKSRRALVVAGETLSLCVDWSIHSLDDLKSRLAGLTLGDAGAAVVMTAVPEAEGRGVLTTRFRSYGEKWRLATVLGGGSMYKWDENHSFFRSESPELRDAAYELIPAVVAEVMQEVGWTTDDVDVICGHQVTEEMVYGLSERCGFARGREMITVTDYGNTAAASIPLCLAKAFDLGLLKPGAKILLCGGAAGFSIGVLPIVW